MAKAMRDYYNENNEDKIGKRGYHFRMVKPEVTENILSFMGMIN